MFQAIASCNYTGDVLCEVTASIAVDHDVVKHLAESHNAVQAGYAACTW